MIFINFPVRRLLNNQRILIHVVDLLIAHLDPNLPEEAGEWKPFKSLLDKTVGDLRLCQSRFRALGERWEDGGHVGNPRLGYLQSQEPTMTCGRLGCTSCNNPRVLFQGMSDHKPGWFMIGFTTWQEIKMLMQQKMVSFTNLQFMENGWYVKQQKMALIIFGSNMVDTYS